MKSGSWKKAEVENLFGEKQHSSVIDFPSPSKIESNILPENESSYHSSESSQYSRIDELEGNLKRFVRDEIRSTFGKIPSQVQLRVPGKATHPQKIKIISLCISSVLSGACISGLVLSTFISLDISPLFFFAMFCSFFGVSLSCIIALMEGYKYDN